MRRAPLLGRKVQYYATRAKRRLGAGAAPAFRAMQQNLEQRPRRFEIGFFLKFWGSSRRARPGGGI